MYSDTQLQMRLNKMNATCTKCGGFVRFRYIAPNIEQHCQICGLASYKRITISNTITRREEKKRVFEYKEDPEQVRKDQEYYAKRNKVRDMVAKYGINGTAKMLNMPRSSVGLLAKGVSPKRWNRGKFGKAFKLKVAKYAIKAKNNYYTAKKFKVSRGAVQNWVREYKQHKGNEWAI
mgnify:FL=1